LQHSERVKELVSISLPELPEFLVQNVYVERNGIERIVEVMRYGARQLGE
jgi:hypothetical protein